MVSATETTIEPIGRAHAWLRNLIVEGLIRPGEPIRQDRLAQELGISKIPLREALARLQQSGLVQRVHNKGFVAAPLSVEEADDVFFARLLLEPPTVRKAVERATDEDTRALERAIEALTATGRAIAESAPARLAVALEMLKPARSPSVERFVTTLFYRSERYLPRGAAEFVSDHSLGDMLQAWKSRRPAAVQEIYAERLNSRWQAARAAAGA